MPEYEVRIKETLERVVTVEATSRLAIMNKAS
jgi:hypothetical protein